MGLNKKCWVLVAGCFGLFHFFGCGDASNDPVTPSISDAPVSSASDMSVSSAGTLSSSSVEDFLLDSPVSSSVDVPPRSSSTTPQSSEGVEISSSSVSFDSAYFGELYPRSSGIELHLSSGAIEVPPRSSSSLRPPPSSDSRPAVNPSPYLIGADISKFQEYESYGTKIFDVDGSQKTIFELLRDHGFNAIRLKTFVSPKAQFGYAAAGCGQDSEAFGDKEHVIAYAKKVKAAGFKFLLDIHYSDVWADPDTQIIPERWRKVNNSDAMADSVEAYTLDLLTALKNANALPDMVQVGNEITNGMLRDLPTSGTNCWGDNVALASNNVNGIMNKQQNPNGIANTAKYLKAGVRAVKKISNNIKTVFHIESPQNGATVNWWMNSIIKTEGAVPDVMAFSAYTAYQHGTPDTWKSLITSLAGSYPNLEFLIAEYNGGTGKNFYGFDGSRIATHQIMTQVPRGLGAFFWEPASYGEWGSALLDWDGNNLKANQRAFDEYGPLMR